jgi:hypothetical protein
MSGIQPTRKRGINWSGQIASAAALVLAAAASQVALGDPLPGIVIGAVVVFAFWVWVFWRQGR